MGYPSETHLKPKSRENVFAHHLILNCPIVPKFCTEHDSITVNFETSGQLERMLWTCSDILNRVEFVFAKHRVYLRLNIVRCRYNAVNFLQSHHNMHPIARPSGRGMGCLLCLLTLIYDVLLQLLPRYNCTGLYINWYDRCSPITWTGKYISFRRSTHLNGKR